MSCAVGRVLSAWNTKIELAFTLLTNNRVFLHAFDVLETVTAKPNSLAACQGVL